MALSEFSPGIFGGLALLLTIGAVITGVRGIRYLSAEERLTTRRQLRLAAIRLVTVTIAMAGGLGSFALLVVQVEILVGWRLIGRGLVSVIVTLCTLIWFLSMYALASMTVRRTIELSATARDADAKGRTEDPLL